MAVIVAISNQKGGVGKTTTAYNLGAYLAKAGKKVLLIDLDPQCNLTKALGIDPNNLDKGTFSLLKDGVAKVYRSGNLAVIPTSPELAVINLWLNSRPEPNTALKDGLEQYDAEFDFIIVDCPPSIDRLVINALIAARLVIVPCQCQELAVTGLQLLMQTMRQMRGSNPKLNIFAVIPTQYTARRSHEQAVLAILQKQFGDRCRAPVPDVVEYVNAIADKRPVNGDQAAFWVSLADDLIKGAADA